MLHLGEPVWQIVVRTVAIYAAILLGLRLMGKRQLGQMNVADLVVILLIANAVQNAMVGSDVSLVGGIVAAVTLLVVNFGITRLLERNPFAERVLEGTPTLLVKDGVFVVPNLRREGLVRDEVEMAIREHGIADEHGVRVAYLEPDGTVSVIPAEAPVLRGGRQVRRVRQLRRH
jgi:uncharacterized membrane protein YcaP (DUF421 family)